MRSLIFAILLIGTALPASGQESGALAAAAPAPSEAALKAIWCAAAFGMMARSTPADQADVVANYDGKAAAGFAKAAAELIPNGMTVEQFRALTEATAAEVVAPFRAQSYSEDECEAAVGPSPAQ